jgi:coiled-coil domain-containing protein 130
LSNLEIVFVEKSDIKRMNTDPMFKLEHEKNDLSKSVKLVPTLNELEEAKLQWRDDFDLNSLMRQKLRVNTRRLKMNDFGWCFKSSVVLKAEKKIVNEEQAKDNEFLKRLNLNINLVKENDDDVRLASLYKYYSLKDNQNDDTVDQHVKRKRIENESIFNSSSSLTKKDPTDHTPHAANNKESKIESLRKRLSKSIEEKKINNLIETSPSDLKSLKFDIRKVTSEKNEAARDDKKPIKLVRLNKTDEDTPKDSRTKITSLVSAQYSDTDSNASDAKT